MAPPTTESIKDMDKHMHRTNPSLQPSEDRIGKTKSLLPTLKYLSAIREQNNSLMRLMQLNSSVRWSSWPNCSSSNSIFKCKSNSIYKLRWKHRYRRTKTKATRMKTSIIKNKRTMRRLRTRRSRRRKKDPLSLRLTSAQCALLSGSRHWFAAS
jgi:hypothetical protein